MDLLSLAIGIALGAAFSPVLTAGWTKIKSFFAK
jgi:hypothetical protein